MFMVDVLPYNPAWKYWFNELKAAIWPIISDIALDMIHVGSTSIEGMSAKPIIDIDVVIDSPYEVPEISKRLENIGYNHIGDMGIEGREVFNYCNSPTYPHNLYVCINDSVALQNHLLLKKHLSENLESFNRYKDLKIEVAKSERSREEYWKSKTMMILEFLEAEGMKKESLDIIKEQNL
jgi:GrpB-like predicted nucleotidyltransferase (UPF0157 family)